MLSYITLPPMKMGVCDESEQIPSKSQINTSEMSFDSLESLIADVKDPEQQNNLLDGADCQSIELIDHMKMSSQSNIKFSKDDGKPKTAMAKDLAVKPDLLQQSVSQMNLQVFHSDRPKPFCSARKPEITKPNYYYDKIPLALGNISLAGHNIGDFRQQKVMAVWEAKKRSISERLQFWAQLFFQRERALGFFTKMREKGGNITPKPQCGVIESKQRRQPTTAKKLLLILIERAYCRYVGIKHRSVFLDFALNMLEDKVYQEGNLVFPEKKDWRERSDNETGGNTGATESEKFQDLFEGWMGTKQKHVRRRNRSNREKRRSLNLVTGDILLSDSKSYRKLSNF